jgi:hypothetical protein
VVDEPLALKPLSDSGLHERVDTALLEHARTNPVLDVLAAAILEHDRLDSLQVQEVREQEARRTGADDADLRAHAPPT